jgi:hypothetical protein
VWATVYEDLSEGKAGLLGSMTSRAEAQVLRLSMVFALLDCSTTIRAEHLRAALAVLRLLLGFRSLYLRGRIGRTGGRQNPARTMGGP